MESLSTRVQSVTPSLTLAVTNQAKAMKAQGEEVYGLAGGEPEMDTPDFIKAAAIRALQEGKTKYTPAAGIPELREGIARKLREEQDLAYEPKQVCVTSGGKQACMNAIMALCDEGDEVIIPSPYWVSYPEMVRLIGAVPVFVETEVDFNAQVAGRVNHVLQSTCLTDAKHSRKGGGRGQGIHPGPAPRALRNTLRIDLGRPT